MNAMPPPEMSMEFSAGELKAGSVLNVNITIPDNWHVNANEAAEEFLKPSEIDVSAEGIHFGKPKWPPYLKEYSEALDLNNQVFRGKIQVELPIDSVSPGYDSLSTSVTFHYQACDNSICLPPAEKTIKLNDFFIQGSSDQNKGEVNPQGEIADTQKQEKFNIQFADGAIGDSAESLASAGDSSGAGELNADPKLSVEYSAGKLKAGSNLTVNVSVPKGWHVNANIAADEFLIPSTIAVSAKGVHFGAPIWPEYTKEFSKALNLENKVFVGNFQVKIPVESVEEGYDSLSTTVTYGYQTCNNSICLSPSEKTIKLQEQAVPVTAESTAESNEQVGENTASTGTIALLLFALLGGLILNLMPCVLPVLSLKLFSLIKQAGESRGRLFALGLSTTAGILVSFWVLAAIITIVKIGGGNAGWGMQFQSAGFIAFMMVILTAFAMSFFGVFEVWLPWSATTKMDAAGQKSGLAGAFFTGALLVLLSTPCSAPFLGTAMGFAFTASAPVLFLFFTAAGVGLAIPYLLASAFPGVLKVFPKPGPWMVKLQKVMGVLLLATVGWLFWIVNNQAGGTGMGLFAAVAAIAIIGSFIAGKFAPPGSAFIREVGVFVGAAAILAGLWFGVLAPRYDNVVQARFNARMAEQMTEDGWYRYSPALIEEMAKAGRTVFIDVSADWCITCKANEAAVLNREDFTRAMDSLNVARVKADWTRESPEVNALLKSMKKSGVPAYAIYPKGDASKQIVLPELLTTGAIVEKITQ